MKIRTRKDLLLEEAGHEGSPMVMSAEELDARMGALEGQYIPPVPDENKPDEQKPDEDKPEDQNTPPAYTPNAAWELVKDVDGFAMPENLTAETEMEALRPFIAKKFGIETPAPVELSPVVKMVNDYVLANPTATADDVFKNFTVDVQDYSKMSDDDVIKADFFAKYGRYDETTNPKGLTDEDVQTEIDGMSKIAKLTQATNIRQAHDADISKKVEARTAQAVEAQEAAYNAKIADIDKFSQKMLAELTKTNDISGIKFSQTDLPNIIDEFKKFVTPDKATGQSKINEMLSDDVNVFNAWYLLAHYGPEAIKEMITRGREDAKESILQKIGLTAPKGGYQGKPFKSLSDDDVLERMKAPDGTFKS